MRRYVAHPVQKVSSQADYGEIGESFASRLGTLYNMRISPFHTVQLVRRAESVEAISGTVFCVEPTGKVCQAEADCADAREHQVGSLMPWHLRVAQRTAWAEIPVSQLVDVGEIALSCSEMARCGIFLVVGR